MSQITCFRIYTISVDPGDLDGVKIVIFCRYRSDALQDRVLAPDGLRISHETHPASSCIDAVILSSFFTLLCLYIGLSALSFDTLFSFRPVRDGHANRPSRSRRPGHT